MLAELKRIWKNWLAIYSFSKRDSAKNDRMHNAALARLIIKAS